MPRASTLVRRFVAVAALASAISIACSDTTAPASQPTPVDASTDAGTQAQGDAGTPPNDASQALDADADAAPQLPRQADIFIWLDASKNVTTTGGAVTAWTDLKAHATVTVTGGTLQPASFNGHPAIAIQAGNVMARAQNVWGLRPMTVFAVAQTLGPTLSQVVLSAPHQTAGGIFSLSKSDTDAQVLFTSRLPAGTPYASSIAVTSVSSRPRLYGVRRKDARHDLRVDGATTSVVNPAGTYDMAADIYFLSSGQSRIAEAIVFDADLSDADLIAVETYLKAKYSL